MRGEGSFKTFPARVPQENYFDGAGGQLGVVARAYDEKKRFPKSIEKNAWKG